MKTLLRLFLVFVVLLVLIAGAAFFALTRPGIQKSLIEGQLPKGSSLRTVRITTSSLELSELKLNLPDGTRVRLGTLDTDFKPLAAIFDRSLVMGALNVDGLVVEVPQVILAGAEGPAGVPSSGTVANVPAAASGSASSVPAAEPEASAAGSPLDALYALGQIDFLFDIESIRLEGELRDGGGSKYGLELSSGAIRPGEETTIEANIKLRSKEALHAGLKEFDSTARLFLRQNLEGGFEEVRLESVSSASDGSGNSLLAATQQLDLKLEGFAERAVINAAFNADLPRPEIILPEMAGVGALTVEGSFSAHSEGQSLTLKGAEFLMASEGQQVVQVDLKKEFSLGAQQNLTGDLMDLSLTRLPLAWLAPWMPEGYRLYGEDFSASFNLTGRSDGAMELRALAPIRVGPVSLDSGEARMLDQVTISLQPLILIESDQSITWDLGDFQVMDRYGEIISGSSTGEFDPSAESSSFIPRGLKTETKLNIGLQELTQQPILEDSSSVMAGRATVQLDVDPAARYPLQVQGLLQGISPRKYPGQRQDYRFAVQLNEPQSGVLALGARLLAGAENRPSSSIQFAGQVRPKTTPLQFKVDLDAPRVSQRDIDFLSAAFAPQQQAPTPSLSAGSERPPTASEASSASGFTDASRPPVWAAYDGELNASIAELILMSGDVVSDLQVSAVVTEPLLSLKQIKASVDGGRLDGSGEVRYSNRKRMAYGIQSDLVFENIDPAVLSKKRSGSFPVRGLFNGEAKFSGEGESLDAAIDDLEGELVVTGREGVLTAFELDNRSQLGLIGAGILGQKFNRPGVTAMAEAVPYFKDMRFSDFTLKMNRGSDKRIVIPEIYFKGDNLLINGSGFIAATNLKQIMDQPLDLSLELGAKGRLVDSLDTLQLLGPDESEDGYRRWNQAIDIGGTLGRPDTTALKRMLNDAAKRAFRAPPPEPEVAEEAPVEGGQSQEVQAQEPTEPASPPKKSKEERILEDIQTGAELLNSLFGN